VLHRRTKVEIGNVETAKPGIRAGKYTVDEEFDEFERDGRGGNFTGEDNLIASYSDPSAIRIFLVGFNFADDVGEANFLASIVGDIVKLNQTISVCTRHTLFLWPFGTNSYPLAQPT
jgi:hypothetical protein